MRNFGRGGGGKVYRGVGRYGNKKPDGVGAGSQGERDERGERGEFLARWEAWEGVVGSLGGGEA